MRSSVKHTRRQFLGRAAALAAPLIVPARVLAAPGPSDTIRVAVIGPGRQGGGFLRPPKGAQLVAVADLNLPRAEAIAAKHKVRAFQDYRKLLEEKDLDAVVVATPDHWHAPCSIHACQAGKDVYIEKPMTLTVREGRLLVEAVRKHGRVLQVGSQQRSQLANRLGCELVRSGALGKISKVLAANYPSPWECALPEQPVPKGLDWDFWCGPTPLVPFHAEIYAPRSKPGWISLRPWSGGEMTGWGSHGLDQIQWALGMDESGPGEVWTEGGKFDPPTYKEPESSARGNKICGEPKVFLRYASGVVVELAGGPGGGGIFHGEKGKLTIDRGKCVSDPPDLAKTALEQAKASGAKDASHVGNWLDCIRSRQKPICDVEIGHRTAAVCHLANIARWLAPCKLTWDPAKEQFPGNDAANALLDRPRRALYTL